MNKMDQKNLRFQYIIPAYNLSPLNITNLIHRLPLKMKLPLIIYNDDLKSPTLKKIKELENKGKLSSIIIPFQVGKTEAIRRGIEEILKNKNIDIDIIIQVDGRQKQPPEDIESLISIFQKSEYDMIIANRYSYQDISNQQHRKTISSTISSIIQVLTGISIPDPVCGTRGYRIKLAKKFLKLRGFGYGLEIEQLIIAGLIGAKVSSVPIHSKQQENFTLAEKIEDNFMTIISYLKELKISNEVKIMLCYILSQIKMRNDFICDLTPLGIPKVIKANIINTPFGCAYTLSTILYKNNRNTK